MLRRHRSNLQLKSAMVDSTLSFSGIQVDIFKPPRNAIANASNTRYKMRIRANCLTPNAGPLKQATYICTLFVRFERVTSPQLTARAISHHSASCSSRNHGLRR